LSANSASEEGQYSEDTAVFTRPLCVDHDLMHTHIALTTPRTPADRLLSASLAIAPLTYLLADGLYAANGWDDANAGAVHVLGAILYGFVAVRFAAWSADWLQASALIIGMIGAAGNVAYGFNTIHVSLGAIDLVDTSGPGAIIKPLGLFFPLSLLVWAVIIARTGRRLSALLVAVASALWPIAHIANIAPLAIAVNALLICGLVPLARIKQCPSEALM
jgi:hypothetical protein